jgi:hypothetical protein
MIDPVLRCSHFLVVCCERGTPRQQRTGLRDFFGCEFAQRQMSQRDRDPSARQFDQKQDARSRLGDGKRVGQHADDHAPPQCPNRREDRPQPANDAYGPHDSDDLGFVIDLVQMLPKYIFYSYERADGPLTYIADTI